MAHYIHKSEAMNLILIQILLLLAYPDLKQTVTAGTSAVLASLHYWVEAYEQSLVVFAYLSLPLQEIVEMTPDHAKSSYR
jgi:hypothetical protein